MPRALFILAFLAAACEKPALKTIVVVRHAEAESENAGPQRQLTERGLARTQELSRILGEVRPSAIFSTPYKRTLTTAEAVSKISGTPVTTIADTTKTIDAVKAAPWGTTLLVVGHSNTVPVIVTALTAQPFAPDERVTHDRLYIVTLGRGGTVSTLRLRYGERDDTPVPQ
jgi:broad specificity phosphatase PhoE